MNNKNLYQVDAIIKIKKTISYIFVNDNNKNTCKYKKVESEYRNDNRKKLRVKDH